jgi:hypothetical protein
MAADGNSRFLATLEMASLKRLFFAGLKSGASTDSYLYN